MVNLHLEGVIEYLPAFLITAWREEARGKPIFSVSLAAFIGWIVVLSGYGAMRIAAYFPHLEARFRLTTFASTWTLFLCVFVVLGSGLRRTDILSFMNHMLSAQFALLVAAASQFDYKSFKARYQEPGSKFEKMTLLEAKAAQYAYGVAMFGYTLLITSVLLMLWFSKQREKQLMDEEVLFRPRPGGLVASPLTDSNELKSNADGAAGTSYVNASYQGYQEVSVGDLDGAAK